MGNKVEIRELLKTSTLTNRARNAGFADVVEKRKIDRLKFIALLIAGTERQWMKSQSPKVVL